MTSEPQFLELGDLELQSGDVLQDARLGYATCGSLNAVRDNVVQFPTYCTGTHRESLALVAAERALDPERYFVVIPKGPGRIPEDSAFIEAALRDLLER